MISDLDESFGSRYFLNAVNETTWRVLHRAPAQIKVPGRSLAWNALLTKMLPMEVNVINGGCEKILPVSRSF